MPRLNLPGVTPRWSHGRRGIGVDETDGPWAWAIGDEMLVTATGGITARRLQDRFADSLNVRDFGAKGDGVADDTAAIQAGLNSGKPLFFPDGAYKVTAELGVSGSFHLFGRNATITSNVNTASIFVANGDLTNFVLRDLELTTTRNDLVNRAGALLYSDGHNVNGGLIENVAFDSASSLTDNVLLAVQAGKTIKDVTIRGCYFTGPAGGVSFLNHIDSTVRVTGIRVVDNRFVHNGLVDDQVGGIAISLSGPHRYADISRNDIRAYPYAGIEVVGKYTGSFDYAIHGNRLEATGRGIIIDRGAGQPVTVRFSRISIVGNIIRQNRFFQRFEQLADSEIVGNHVETIDTSTSTERLGDYVAFDQGDRVTVAGNQVNLDFPGAEFNKAQIALWGWTNSTISGNRFRTTGITSLRFDGTTYAVTDNAITGNSITQAPTGTANYPVQLTGANATRNMLTGNVITTTTGLTISQTSSAANNWAEGTLKVRSDTALVSRMDFTAWTVTGALDLSAELGLGQAIRLNGTPLAGFTVTLPAREANYYISNQTGQTATITATSGAPTVAAGSKAFVFVTANGVATLF